MSFNKTLLVITALLVSVIVTTKPTHSAITMKPTPLQGLDYQGSILSGNYRGTVTKPEAILGFPVGKMTATPAQIIQAVSTWEKESNLMQVTEYARSHEGRPLVYTVISSEKNLQKLDQIKSDIGRLADPRGTSTAATNEIIARLPGVAWMAYSIHGNETSGADSALAAIYHLIASEDPMITQLLDDLVIIIDPSMNPDGRARFTKTMQENRQVTPNVDDQSLLHTGYWPYGRTNHYLFDLNRDFVFGVHPETQGRVKALNEWYPQLMIDGHEMGSQDTYLFGPPREPINKNIAKSVKRWSVNFSEDQGEAFDAKNWPYYTGEWFENLFVGYSNYVEYRGSIHILYEQARMAEDGVRQGNDRIVSYAESVDHQFVSTIANLQTLAKHSKDIYKDFAKDRRLLVSKNSPYADKTYAFVPTGNNKRMREFLNLLKVQGFELQQLSRATKLSDVTNAMGENETVTLPAGTVLLNNRQPEARLIAGMLELDPKILDEVLVKERQRTLRDGSSVMYDTTAWNVAMMHGIKFYRINDEISKNVVAYSEAKVAPSDADLSNAIAYMVDGQDDASIAFAARLMEQGVQVRVSDKKSAYAGVEFSRGSVLVNRYDNEFFNGDLKQLVTTAAQELSLSVKGITTGYGKGDLPELGGSHFELLERPRIALLARAGINT
ncbi:MAG: peptidase, partial [Gammaproteobacteria bacterium]|nr:peptidase [Gammaproteobacteria bacterium]